MSVARLQTQIGLLVIAAVFGTSLALGMIARDTAITKKMEKENDTFNRRLENSSANNGDFQSMEEIWLYHDIPGINFSQGSVDLFGPSSVEYSTRLADLAPPLPRLMHNFALPGCNAQSQLSLLKYLNEKKGLFSAGGEKTLIILGMEYHTCYLPSQQPTFFTVDALERHHLYTIDSTNGIRETYVNPVSKFLDFEETRQAACLGRFEVFILHKISLQVHHGVPPLRHHNPPYYGFVRRALFGADWKNKIDQSIPVFRETLNYLRNYHAQVKVVLMPEGTWETNLPFSTEFKKEVVKLCAEENVPVLDWTKMLDDREFADYVHPNLDGMDEVQPAFLKLALPFLKSTAALPENFTSP